MTAEFSPGDLILNLVTNETLFVVEVDHRKDGDYYVLEKKVRSLPARADEVEGRYKKVEL